MNKKLREKILEALSSVVPITGIVFVLSVSLVPIPIGTILMFLAGASMLIVGMGFFSLGADISMMPIGEAVGSRFGKARKLWLFVLSSFAMGFIITIAEPDLQVLARQVPSIPDAVLILTVALGVGFFLVVATLRVFFHIRLSTVLVFFYAIVFLVAAFAHADFTPVAFDSGGVTTGPITVPFIIALGIGLSAMQAGKEAHDDSFGLVAICSIGPILAVLVLGMVYNPSGASYTPVEALKVTTTKDVALHFARHAPAYMKEVLLAVVPICIFFALFQLASRKFTRKQLLRVCIGLAYTMIGLVMFLTGVNVGFIPVGHLLGSEIAASSYKWALIPLGMIIGYYIVAAEPAVHVLNRQVENITGGAISQRAMRLSLSLGVASSLGLAMFRILTGIPILWLLLPGYAAALLLTFFVPKIFVGIAFDSGGVASGPMTATFLLPFAMGSCESLGGNVLTDAFGVVAMVAMTPLIAIQLMGLVYERSLRTAAAREKMEMPGEDEIIEYEEVLSHDEERV